MADHTEALAGLVALESVVFRMGATVRRLLADHPDLPAATLYPYADVERARVSVSAAAVPDVGTWAERLGLTVEVSAPRQHNVFGVNRMHEARGLVDGIELWVFCRYYLTADEAQEWQAQQAERAGAEASS